LLLIGSGCGGKDKNAVRKVTGTVKYKGEKLVGGTVTFVGGENGKERVSSIIQDGSYSIPNAPAGEVKISIDGPTRSSDASKAKEAPPVVLPAKYSDPAKSGLTYTVTDGTQTHDIELP
jgi:hypothetical protein